MKNKLKLSVIILSFSIIPTAFSMSEKFEGATIDRRCTLSISPSLIDIGLLSQWQLMNVEGDRKGKIGKRTTWLEIICPYAQSMSFLIRGDKANNGDLKFGNIGSISIKISDLKMDGKRIFATVVTDKNIERTSENQIQLQPGSTVVAKTNGQLAKGKNFTARIDLEPTLSDSKYFSIPERQKNEANFTLELTN